MDPLSISISIIGLCCAAVQVNGLLKKFIDSSKDAPATARHTLTEVSAIYFCLNQLEAFLSGRQQSSRSRRSLVMLEQVIVIFTDCVSIFSELEQILDSIKTDGPTRILDRMKWAVKEKAILKLLTRLQTSKASLGLLLNILMCTSLESAQTTTRDLSGLIQQVLKSNVNMSRRLRNIERMHPALMSSASPSFTTSVHEHNLSQLSDTQQSLEIPFEKELKHSAAYKRTAFNQLRASNNSSNATSGPSFLSGLSLCDVLDATSMALPISRTELWNHHRYVALHHSATSHEASALDAWYNPSAKKSAFIRTAYFDGQYTNQYAQAKFTGHLIYRRFSVSGPNRPPRFKEGLMIPSGKEHEAIIQDNEVEPGYENIAELEDTSACAVETSCIQRNNQRRCGTSERHQHDVEVVASCGHDSSSAWGQE
ncbi:MAG: hypothetical protein Q9180_007601, partial [Flavoplaca navasiana]